MNRKSLILFLTFALIFGISSTSSSGIGNTPQTTDALANCKYGTNPLSEFTPATPNPSTTINQLRNRDLSDPCAIYLMWTSEVGPSFSYSALFARVNPYGAGQEIICVRGSDPACSPDKFPNGGLRSLAGFYKCESDTDINCISQLIVTDPKGQTQDAKFERYFPDAPQIPASDNPKLIYPKGGSPILWSFETPYGKKHIYSAGVTSRDWSSNGKEWQGPFTSFNFGLQAVTLHVEPNGIKPTLQATKYTMPDGREGSRVEFVRPPNSPGGDGPCRNYLVLDTGYCLANADFMSGYRYRVVFQVPADLGFFLNGRLDQPVAYTEPFGSNRRLIIEGAPATLFMVSGTIPKKYLTPEAVAAIKSARSDFGEELGRVPTDLPPMENRYPDLLSALLPYFGDRTTMELQAWTLKSTPTLGRFTNQCTNGGRGEMLGIISTNATAFDGDPPVLDPDTKILSYKVAAPHFGVDGKTENIGKYYMNMNANFIKCILGVDKVPAVAQIGITSTGQAERVSTVTVKTDKDWLRLNVDNFTFSSPKINVKFEAPAIAENTPTQRAEVKSTPALNKRTITCAKGRITKKITATNPKCPTGYKKK